MIEMKKYKLGELIEVTRGMSLPGDKYAESGDLIRLTLGNFNLQGNGFKPNTSKTDIYFTGSVKKEFIMKKGDIITPLTEQTYGLLGSTARIPESGKYIQSQDVALIKSKSDKLYEDFCYYLISSPSVRKQLGAAAQQTKIRHTSPDKIKDCEVIIPEDVKQQIKITNLLNIIGNKIALNNKTNTELENMAKTIYDYWFTQFDFPDKNGHPYKTSGGQMVYNEILKREIPAGWEVGKLSDIAEVFNGSTPSTKEDDNYGGNIVWITPKDLSDQQKKFTWYGERNITEKGYKDCNTTLVPKGTILLSSRAPIGLVSIAACELCTNQGFKNIVPKNLIFQNYNYYVIKTNIPKIEQLGSGTTFKEVSKQSMESFKVIIPPLDIIEKYNHKVCSIFDEQLKLLKENDELMKVRDYHLPLLMNGQIEVK